MHIGAGHPPWAFVELQLCKLYHCPPGMLDEEDAERMLLHLELEGVARQVAELHAS